MGNVLHVIIRCFPFASTVFFANHLHYTTLNAITRQARRSEGEHEEHRILSYQLTKSLAMRRVRYWIKLVRYTSTIFFLLLSFPLLPELWDLELVLPSAWTVAAGLLCAVVTIGFHENVGENWRTKWQPQKDFHSPATGMWFNVLRMIGSCVLVPIEEELLFNSLLYRELSLLLEGAHGFNSFSDVPFDFWSWKALLITTVVFGWQHGKEWKSSSVSFLIIHLRFRQQGSFQSALAVHSIANSFIGLWVLTTGCTDFW